MDFYLDALNSFFFKVVIYTIVFLSVSNQNKCWRTVIPYLTITTCQTKKVTLLLLHLSVH